MFLGDELTAVIEAITHKESYQAEKSYLEMGLNILPRIRRDTTDRNRTSPFAFTGNKFEFRMLGSSFSIADANTVLNTAVADALRAFADELEQADDFSLRLGKLIRREFRAHKRILFNGNNYAPEWVEEAEKRGLCNYRSSVDAIGHLTDGKNVELFARHGVFTGEELASRREIMYENYAKIVHIEALTMLDMVRREILPSVVAYTDRLWPRRCASANSAWPAPTKQNFRRNFPRLPTAFQKPASAWMRRLFTRRNARATRKRRAITAR